jgi:predicted metalloendopeptidase
MTSLQDYFIISYITKVASTLYSSSRNALKRVVCDLLLGTTVEKPRWRTCVDSTSEVFDASLGRYYILHAFGSEIERNKTEAFITPLHDSWRKRIPATEWLDAETKEKVMEKVCYNIIIIG